MTKIESMVKRGIKYLDWKKKSALRCPICGNLDFIARDIIFVWLTSPPLLYDLKKEEREAIQKIILEKYVSPENVCRIETHHLSYTFDITMPLCKDCHMKVHHSFDFPWTSFKPVDKRKSVKFYDAVKDVPLQSLMFYQKDKNAYNHFYTRKLGGK